MSKKQLLFMLEEAAEKEGQERFDLLKIAGDYTIEHLTDEDWQQPNLLIAYTLHFLAKHKKFPKITSKTTTSKRNSVPFVEAEVRKQFFKLYADDPPANLTRAFSRFLRTEKQKHFEIYPKKVVKNTTVTYYLGTAYDEPIENYWVLPTRAVIHETSFEKLLQSLAKALKYFYEWFVL